MNKDSHARRIDTLKAELWRLESLAAISNEIARAREPLMFPDMNATPDEYFADQHDSVRSGTRDAYFSVMDRSLRKQLIAADRAIDKVRLESSEEDAKHERQLIAAAEKRASSPPWIWAGCFAVGIIFVGNWTFGLVGAIAGAVGSVFFGLAFISNDRAVAGYEKSAAEGVLKGIEETITEIRARPEFFSRHEDLTGERDSSIDHESALGNLYRKQEIEKQH